MEEILTIQILFKFNKYIFKTLENVNEKECSELLCLHFL